MDQTVRILIFDDSDVLLDELYRVQLRYPALEILRATHINDLIVALDEYIPQIIIVNDKLASYESLTILALLKRKRPAELPRILFVDTIKSIKEYRSEGENISSSLLDELGSEIETILIASQTENDRLKRIDKDTILDALPFGVMTLDGGDRITYCNKCASEYFSLETDEILRSDFESELPIIFLDHSYTEIKEMILEKDIWKGNVYFRSSDGLQVLHTLEGHRLKGNHLSSAGILFFISKENQFQHDYRSIIDNFSDGVFILANERIIFSNETFDKMLGFNSDEISRLSPLEIIEDEDRIGFYKTLRDIQNFTDTEKDIDIRFIHSNGINRIYTKTKVSLMQYPEGLSILCIVKDITERKMTELIKDVGSVESRSAEFDPQNARSHDFMTLMNTIIGFADILRERFREPGDDPNLSLYAEQIYSAGRKMSAMLEQGPDTESQIMPGVQPAPETLNLGDIVAEAIGSVRELALQKGLRITLVHSSQTHILADKKYLNDVVNRLLKNSLEVTASGAVVVDTGIDSLKAMAFIRIKDGNGEITEDILPALFDPVVSNSQNLSSALQNTATVFSIAKRLMELMNGKFDVQTAQGKGTTHSLYIPIDENVHTDVSKQANIYYTVSPELIYLNELRPSFLIIEDDPGSSKMLEVTLRTISRLTMALSGEQALKIIESNFEEGLLFDLVLMDIGLPEPWNGVTLRKHIISQFPEYQKIPFIAETAFVIREEKQTIIESGFNGYISKPIDRRYLIKTLAAALRRSHGD